MYNKNDDSLMFEAYKKSKEPKKTKASKEKEVIEASKDVCNCFGDEICAPCKKKQMNESEMNEDTIKGIVKAYQQKDLERVKHFERFASKEERAEANKRLSDLRKSTSPKYFR